MCRPRKISLLFVVLILLPFATSCAQLGEDPVRISVLTDKFRYTPGESIFILVELENTSDNPIHLVNPGRIELDRSREDSIRDYTLQCMDCAHFRATLLPGAADIFGFEAETIFPDGTEIEEGRYSMIMTFWDLDEDEVTRRIVSSNELQIYDHPEISSSADSIWVWQRRFASENELTWREEFSHIASQESDAVLRNTIIHSLYRSRIGMWARGEIPGTLEKELSDYIAGRPDDVLSGCLLLRLSRKGCLDALYSARKSEIDSSRSLIANMVRLLLRKRRK